MFLWKSVVGDRGDGLHVPFLTDLGYYVQNTSQAGGAMKTLTGALLNRLTHHVHILELNGESYLPKRSKARRRHAAQAADDEAAAVDPETGEITP
jgi:hypothetical protein